MNYKQKSGYIALGGVLMLIGILAQKSLDLSIEMKSALG